MVGSFSFNIIGVLKVWGGMIYATGKHNRNLKNPAIQIMISKMFIDLLGYLKIETKT